MLQSLRDKLQGWIAWTIITAICLVFALWGVHSYLYGRAADNVVAKVNGTKITKQQLDVVYNQMRRQQQLQLGANYSPSDKAAAALKQTALQSIISSMVLNKAARSDGFRVDPVLVEALLAKMPIFQVSGVFSQAKFEQFVNTLLYSTDAFLAQLKNEILVSQVKNGIVGTAFTLPQEIDQLIKLVNQKRSFNYLIIPMEHFLAQVKLPAKAVENFYHENLDNFKLPEKVSIQYLQLSMANLMRGIKPTAVQLKDFYNTNIVSYTKPKRWHLAGIMIAVPKHASKQQMNQAQQKLNLVVNKIKQHVDFAALAKQYSDDTATAAKGGEWSWITEAQLPTELRAVLPNLKKAGDITVPIKTMQGYYVLQLLGTQPQQVISFNKVKDKVLQAYKQQAAERKFADLRDKLANITYENADSLQPAAKQLSLPIQTTDLFTKNGGKGIAANPRIIAAAFDDEVLSQHENSDPIDLSDNSVVVLRIKRHVPASVKKFVEVKTQIANQLRRAAAAQQAEDLGNTVIKELQSGKTLNDIANKYHLNKRVITNVGRHAKKPDTNVLTAAFHIAPSMKKSVPAVTGLSLPTNDYVVIVLTGVKEGDVKQLTASARQAFQQTAIQQLGLLEYQLYASDLMQKAKIKKFPQN
ncbi:MAG: SurA N-terminal domain-containing protein [Gammaproteobacteria bacterium]|jgi:peptidyl-prolyl cis-trans isomerase D